MECQCLTKWENNFKRSREPLTLIKWQVHPKFDQLRAWLIQSERLYIHRAHLTQAKLTQGRVDLGRLDFRPSWPATLSINSFKTTVFHWDLYSSSPNKWWLYGSAKVILQINSVDKLTTASFSYAVTLYNDWMNLRLWIPQTGKCLLGHYE